MVIMEFAHSSSLSNQPGAMTAPELITRIDALPSSPGLWRFIILLAIGGFFELYDLFQTAYISPGLIAEGIFHTGSQGVFGISDQAAFASSTFLGLFVGTSLLSPLADKFGRRLTFMFALLWYSFFTLLIVFQNQAEWIILLRFLVGVGLGIELVTIDTYLVEMVPTRLRSRAFAFSFFIQFLSVPAVALISWWFVPHTWFGLTGWRYVLLVSVVFSLFIWVVRKKLPESPRWLMQHGQPEKAQQVLEELEKQCGVGKVERLDHLVTLQDEHQFERRGRFKEIWTPQFRSRTIMLMIFNIFQAIGFFGFGNWLPALLAGQGSSFTHSLSYSIIITLGFPIGCLVSVLYADKFEIKWQVVAGALGVVIFGALFGFQRSPLGMILCGFMVSYCNAWMTYSFHSYQTEIFPTRIRVTAVGFCYSFSRLSTVFSSIIIGLFLEYTGNIGVLAFIVASMAMVVLVISLLGPKTKDIELENI